MTVTVKLSKNRIVKCVRRRVPDAIENSARSMAIPRLRESAALPRRFHYSPSTLHGMISCFVKRFASRVCV